jgi:hypothetical protein
VLLWKMRCFRGYLPSFQINTCTIHIFN